MGITAAVSQDPRWDRIQWLRQLYEESICEQAKEVAYVACCICKIYGSSKLELNINGGWGSRNWCIVQYRKQMFVHYTDYWNFSVKSKVDYCMYIHYTVCQLHVLWICFVFFFGPGGGKGEYVSRFRRFIFQSVYRLARCILMSYKYCNIIFEKMSTKSLNFYRACN